MATATRADRTPAVEKSKPPIRQREWFVATVFMAPFVILFCVFRFYAVLNAVMLSFQELGGFGGETEWVGLDNYTQLLRDDTFWIAVRNTVTYTAGTLLVLIPIPFIIAAVFHSKMVKRTMLWRTIFFLPVLTSLVVVGVVFLLLLSENGLVNQFLGLFGIAPVGWLDTRNMAVPALVILATWRWTGINIIYFTTGLSNIPADLYEAASMDGASPLRKFWHLSVPLSKPIIVFVVIITLIGGFQLFVEPFILWSGTAGPGQGGLSIVLLLYREAFTSFRLGYASALGVVLALIIMVVSVIQLRMFGFGKDEDK